MKKLALIFALLLVSLALFSCSSYKLVAKDAKDSDGNAVTGYYDKNDTLIYEEKLDSDGKVAKKTSYDYSGRVEKIEEFHKGNKSAESVFTYEEDDKYTKTQTVYNNKGEQVSVKETKFEKGLPVSEKNTVNVKNGDPSVQESTFTYNDDGSVLEIIKSGDKKIREVLTSKDENVLWDCEYAEAGTSIKTHYNEDGIAAKTESYNKDGALVMYVVNEYNDNKKITGSKTYDGTDAIKSYSTYVYDEAGEKLRAIYRYNADGTINSTITYDENGKSTIHSGTLVPLD